MGGNTTYNPSEDSRLLQSVISSYDGENFLEIGTGSGFILEKAATRFQLVVGSDVHIDRRKPREFPQPRFEFVLADRATCFRENSFDIVAFNPPYLPSDTIEDITIDGGIEGVEVPISFLQDAKRVLKPEGRIIMLLSSESSEKKIQACCSALQLSIRPIASLRIFYESLTVYELKRKSEETNSCKM